MNDEKRVAQKHVRTIMTDDEDLPTLYVNSVDIKSGLDDFFLTFGTAQPLEIRNSADLEEIDSVQAQALFRCAISRSVMKQMIDLMASLYENQTRQIELLQALQGKEEHDGNDSSNPSES